MRSVTSFVLDGDAWTCPKCGATFRSNGRHPSTRQADRRKVRDSHKCKGRS